MTGGDPIVQPKLTLSFGAIFVIAANTMNGPGLTTLPATALSAGSFTYTIMVVLAASVTTFVLARLCVLLKITRSIAEPTTDLVSLSGLILKHQRLACWIMVACALALALAQMMLCAAIVDSMIVATLGVSCGFGVPFRIFCTDQLSVKPFQDLPVPTSLVSIGLLLSSMITVSLAFVDLDSMLMAQYVLFGCLLLACARFSSTLLSPSSDADQAMVHAEPSDYMWVGSKPFDAVGPILFNFAFVVTIPPLAASVRTRVAIRALVVATAFMAFLYVGVGSFGAYHLSHLAASDDNNLLSLVLSASKQQSYPLLDHMAVSLFGLSQLAAIPVYCQMAMDTLLSQSILTSKRRAFVLAHIAPWFIVALTYNSPLFEAFVEWSSLLLLGFANFSLPLLLDQVFHGHQENKGHNSTIHSTPLLLVLSITTATIAAVIIQRATDSMVLAEAVFMISTLVQLMIL
eukprot:Nitzschia sp. Nitz4//scaffold14_size191712//111179//112555//NITZ4_001732-RA/size191712-processed-gene-0.277-mRNA-1//1//CDS//3329536954//3956//frame0